MNQKTINLFLSALILLGSLTAYFFYEQLSHFDRKRLHEENIKLYFEQDSAKCTSVGFLENPGLKKEAENSQFQIEIYKRDSLVYWNKENNTTPTTNFVKRFRQGNYNYKFSLDVNENFNTRHGFTDFVFYFLWLTGILLLFLGIYHSCKRFQKPVQFLGFYVAILIAAWYGISLAGSYIFQYSANLNKDFQVGNFHYYLWQFGTNLVLIFFLFLSLENPIVNTSKSPSRIYLRYLGGAALVAFLLYYLIANIEFFIQSKKGIEVKIEEPMNVDFSTLTFYILLILHVGPLVYLSKKLFGQTTTNISGWLKTLYFTVSVVTITFVFVYLGFQTNVIGVVLFLMIILLVFDLYFEYFDINTSFLLSSVLVFSIFLSSIIFTVAEKHNRAQILNTINQITQPLGDNEIYELNGINNEIINSQLFPFLSSLEYLNYLDVKDIKTYITRSIKNNPKLKLKLDAVYCYDSKGNSLARNQVANKSQIQNIINESEVIHSNLFYSPMENIALLHYNVDNGSDPSNPIHLSILFTDNNTANLELPYKRDIAIYKKNQLIRTTGINEFYNYPDVINDQTLQLNDGDIMVKRDVFTYLSRTQGNAITKFLPLLTLFIAVFGLLVLLFIVLNSIFNITSHSNALKINTKYSLQGRFQTTIISLILFTFVLIGGTTAYYYKKLYQQKELQRFNGLLSSITNDIQNDIPVIDDVRSDSRLEKSFSKISKNYSIPLAFYKNSGERLLINEYADKAPKRLLKSFVEKYGNGQPNLVRKIRSIQYKQNEILLPTYDSANKISGYFYLENQKNSLKYSGLYDFLSTLLTICVFLFLTSLAVSIIISTPMSKSLKNLAFSLQNFKLGKTNEKLEWSSNDEIGALIHNFNQMQIQLNQSADLLSKTQREMAWREMAKQVAHEIKNPLTPMKLSIQHLQYAAKADPEKIKPMVEKTAMTILDQIENLTQIADEFSSFGTLPKTSNDTFILNDVVEHIHDLFRKREDMDIVMDELLQDIYVFADRTQLVRVLNNIVKNATQSIPETKRGKIKITLDQNDHFAIIKVSDNGVGIPENMKDKVFTPNFTTKSSGTGLGLAISANVIESMNGRIYFKSPNEDGGTDFFVELPLVRSSNNEGEVSLD